jgi:molybdopterin-guanine dinucleotide biosynthesis protein A
MNLAGIILCGGQSRRMGTPKEWLDFDGEPLLTRMIRLICSETSPVFVAGSVAHKLPPLTASVIRVDDQTPDCGPIEGLFRGLLAARNKSSSHAFIAAVDLPLLRPPLIARMRSLLQPSDDAVVISHEGLREPLLAIYRVGIVDVVAEAIAAQQYALMRLLDRLHLRELTAADYEDIDPEGDCFFNINTPEDYQQALQRYSKGS